jgi:hypothetical protein
MTAPTYEEIQEEIKRLKTMKPNVLSMSVFGDDHHAAINAQIQVLEDGLDEDAAYEENMDNEDNIREAAEAAARWSEGDEDNAPSEDWKSLVR